MPDIPTNIFDELIRDEALRLKPYRDNSKALGFEGRPGKLTIAIGRNLDDRGVTKEESIYLCQNDVALVTSELRLNLPWLDSLCDPSQWNTNPRMCVLLNMGFNMGAGAAGAGLLGFRNMLSWLKLKDYPRAAAEMADSAWYNETGARAARLVQQMITGEWQ